MVQKDMDEELLAKLGTPTCQFCGALIGVNESKKQQSAMVIKTISAILQMAPVRDAIVDDVMGEVGAAKALHSAAKKPAFCRKCIEAATK